MFTRGNTARQAMAAFDDAFDELASARIDNDKAQALANDDANTFVPKLEAYDGSTTLPDVFIPKTPGARYLQAWFTANFNDDWARAAAAGMSLERFETGEVVEDEGSIPDGMRFLRHGLLSLRVAVPGAGSVQLDEILPGDYIGMTTLTKENITPAAIALDEVEMLFAPQAVIEDLVARDAAAGPRPRSPAGPATGPPAGADRRPCSPALERWARRRRDRRWPGAPEKCLGHHLRVGSGRTGRLVDDAPDQGTGRGRESVFRFRYVSITLQRLRDRVKNRPVAPNGIRSTARQPAVKHQTFATSSDRAHDQGVALPAAAAQGGRAGAAATTAQLVEQRQGEAVAAHADRVAEGDGPAVDVDDVAGDAEIGHRRQADGGERLVDLEQVEVADCSRPARSRALRMALLGCCSSDAESGPATMP